MDLHHEEDSQLDYVRVEDIKKYTIGGFHPVHLGDQIGSEGRFEVQHKLGFSDSSTAWLCLDRVNERHVAVKILQAAKSTESHPDICGMRLFDNHDRQDIYSKRLFPIEESFWISGPNGRHLCLVAQILGPSISYALKGIGLDTPETLKSFSLQAAQCLKYLHSQRICHGNFCADNMRLQFNLDAMKDKSIYEIFGKPRVRHLEDQPDTAEGTSGQPKYLVEPANTHKAEYEFRTGVIGIDSFSSSRHTSDPTCPLKFASQAKAKETPPEIRFLNNIGFFSDIWALGCAIHLIRTDRQLLANLDSKSSMVSWISWCLGPFSKEMWKPVGHYLDLDGAVPVFTANVPSQETPNWINPSTIRIRADAKGYPLEWGRHRRRVVDTLLNNEECPRDVEYRQDLRKEGDRSHYLRVKLPTNQASWKKCQDARRKLTGFASLLHEDLSKERTWYQETDVLNGEAGYEPERSSVFIDDEILERMNPAWKNGSISEKEAEKTTEAQNSGGVKLTPSEAIKGRPEASKKRALETTDEELPQPKRVKPFVAKQTFRDRVECVEQKDGMTRFSYCLQPKEVGALADLLSKMLKNDPKERIGIDEVLAHKWFRHD
ncbi:kinase-like domain-containing protein [Xylariaceae sp. FL1272]|nr:kinase-like domain-containing protein [Xylariaceae sp. FL1272]